MCGAYLYRMIVWEFFLFTRSVGIFIYFISSCFLQVSIVTNMVKTSRSMRCFVKGSSNRPLLQFSGYSEHNNDPGDGGGIPVFTLWSISCFGTSTIYIFCNAYLIIVTD